MKPKESSRVVDKAERILAGQTSATKARDSNDVEIEITEELKEQRFDSR